LIHINANRLRCAKIKAIRERELAMRLAPLGHDLRLWFRGIGPEAGGRRGGVPWHESLLLAALLLVVVGWIALRLLLSLLAA
jgi:hypothetical protein